MPTLREKVQKLLAVRTLPADERKWLNFVLESVPDGPLEGMMYPDVQAHVEGRYEWFYRPDGALRRAA